MEMEVVHRLSRGGTVIDRNPKTRVWTELPARDSPRSMQQFPKQRFVGAGLCVEQRRVMLLWHDQNVRWRYRPDIFEGYDVIVFIEKRHAGLP